MQNTAKIIRALNAIIEEYAETIKQLREEARGVAPLPADIPYLTPYEDRALRALFRREGVVSADTIYRAIYDDSDGVDTNVIPVLIFRIRKKLPACYRIINIRSRGYRLDRPIEPQEKQ